LAPEEKVVDGLTVVIKDTLFTALPIKLYKDVVS
jgi:hypothetical protein